VHCIRSIDERSSSGGAEPFRGFRGAIVVLLLITVGASSTAGAAEPDPLTPATAGDGRVRVDLRSSKHDFPVGRETRGGDDAPAPKPLCTTPCTVWLPIGTTPLRVFDPEPQPDGQWRSMALRISVNGPAELGIRPGRPRRYATGGWVVALSAVVAVAGAGLLGFELASEHPREPVWAAGAGVGAVGVVGAIAGLAVLLTSTPSVEWSRRPR
jgi:hypothetical protein